MTARDVTLLEILCNRADENLRGGLQQHKVVFVFGKVLLHDEDPDIEVHAVQCHLSV